MQVPGVLAAVNIALAEASPAAAAATRCEEAQRAVVAALAIDAGHVPSLLLQAEVHAAAAKVAGRSGLDATPHWHATRDAYRVVLQNPTKLGSCSERCTIRYNYACALSMCGEVDEAVDVLLSVAGKDPSALQGAASDSELAAIVSHPRLAPLLS